MGPGQNHSGEEQQRNRKEGWCCGGGKEQIGLRGIGQEAVGIRIYKGGAVEGDGCSESHHIKILAGVEPNGNQYHGEGMQRGMTSILRGIAVITT